MRTFLSCSVRAFVSPEMNQSSSSATPRQKTRLVVSSGKTSSRRLQREVMPNLLIVPVPVRSSRGKPVAMMSRMASRYWCSSWRAGGAPAPEGRTLRARPCSARFRNVANWKSTPFSLWRGRSATSAKAASSTSGTKASHSKSRSTRVT